VGDDYMNFRLEAEERLGETSVLVIRREGRYTVWLPESARCWDGSSTATPSEVPAKVPTGGPGNGTKMIPVVTQRRGVTLFAWNRGAVLEDRFLDCVVEAGGQLSVAVGVTELVVRRLMRSRPLPVRGESL
jgi:hypothetical protein